MTRRGRFVPVVSMAVAVCAALAVVAEAQPAPLPDAGSPFDSTAVTWSDSSATTARADTLHGGVELKVVKRTYRYREQLRVALFMMGFVALTLFASQTLNPD